MAQDRAFKPVPSQVDLVAQEHEVLRFWERSDAFRKLQEKNRGGERFSFIDGPITANNPMGAHHAWGRTYKDVFQRYRAMCGLDQRWQNGFDCQGLWVEVNVERDQGFKTKKDIEDYGLAPFVNLCKQRVLEYAAVQAEQSIRLGYWMDWDDPALLRELRAKMAEDPDQVITVEGPEGPVTDSVEQVVGRLGLPELGGSYFTFSNENNYAIWTALRKCHENGWIYKGTDVMPWCARCGTGISQHEIVTEGYQELTHTSVFLRFPLRNRPGEDLLVWTTTPWTLSSNVAAAVHPDLPYVLVETRPGSGQEGEARRFWLSKGSLDNALRGEYAVLDEKQGAELEGWTYDGPFDELPAQVENEAVEAHRVILWEEVGEAEGTGIVHIAPGCGAEDFQLSKQYHLPVIAPLSENGIFQAGFDWLTGMSVHETAEPIFANLEGKGVLYRLEDYTHRYPVCWRCHEELVFRLVAEWLIHMGEQLDKPYEMVTAEEKANNLRYQIMDSVQETRWIPDFGFDREMDWLRNMHDWMISKKRYWGLALPIWECQECGWFDVIGSEKELAERAIAGWDDFQGHTPHRPYIDAVQIRCEQCGAAVSRIADVGNPWLDAGIVAYSTLRYRTDRDYWQAWFPADLITESFPGQFRNWFYSMLAMSTIMERRAPFRTVQTYATLFAEDGRPMHKSWGNMIEFNEAADNMGVDVMRWMYCAHKPETNLLFGYHRADDTRRRFLIPVWNVYSFFVTYANLDEWTPDRARPPAELSELDRWMLARLNQVVARVTEAMEGYDPYGATLAIEPLLDDLTNWYVRRSRRRFWKSEHDADKEAAYATLYQVLVTLAKMLAPLVPFVTEVMYQNLVRSVDDKAEESVHHCDWPQVEEQVIDQELLERMGLAMRMSGLGRSARSAANVKLRQPLARARVYGGDGAVDLPQSLADLVADELNVKEIDFVESEAELVEYEIGLLPNLLGPKHGPRFPRLRQAIASLSPAEGRSLARRLRAGLSVTIELEDGGAPIELLPEETEVRLHGREGYALAEERGLVVAVDVGLTPALLREGLARDMVRRIQALRKEADYALDDRIETYYESNEEIGSVVAEWGDYIEAETLSVALVAGTVPGDADRQESFNLAGNPVTLAVKRA